MSELRPNRENPFPGLRPFDSQHSHLFFGREEHIEALLQKLSSRRFSAVVGTSGSGKSSLVFAGILPRLARGYRTRTRLDHDPGTVRSVWRVARMRPGDDPIGNLATALQRAGLEADDEISPPPASTRHAADDASLEHGLLDAQLRRSQQGLSEAAHSLALAPSENLLIIVDQFEELFRFRELSRTLEQTSDPAAAFVQLLLRATEQTLLPIYVTLTMRSDFFGECVRFSGLAEAINEGQFLLPLLNRNQRELVIRGPMAVVNAPIAPALVQRLLNDAGDMTDQLPVLQHALMRSFELWQARAIPEPELRLTHYQAAGGMSSALCRHADEALEEIEADLGELGMVVAERLFRALTDRGAEGRGVRRPCRVSEILAVAETELGALERVIQRFVEGGRGFLTLQPESGPLTADTVVDISHEALMRVWERLRTWSDREFTFANQLQYLASAQHKHQVGLAGLWSDPELSLALHWMDQERPTAAAARRYGVDLARVDGFLEASVAAQQEAAHTAVDAQTWRRFKRMFSEAKTSTLIGLLAIFVALLVQGSGVLDRFLPVSTRFNQVSIIARNWGVERGLDGRVSAIVIDDETVRQLQAETRLGVALGEPDSKWRLLYAEVLDRLVSAGASVVALNVSFDALPASELEIRGTEALSTAIQNARRRGTAVILPAFKRTADTGEPLTAPLIRQALTASDPAAVAPGMIADSCLGIPERNRAIHVIIGALHPGRDNEGARPYRMGVALGAVSSFFRAPDVVVDADDRVLFLFGGGLQREVGFAALGNQLRASDTRCEALVPGDIPVHQIVDLSPRDWQRGDPGIVPFESVLAGTAGVDLHKQIVLIGKQLHSPDPKTGEIHKSNAQPVYQCGNTPWSCGLASRWPINLQLDTVNNLLKQRVLRSISPALQLLVMLLLCLAVAAARVWSRGRPPWLGPVILGGLVAVDLAFVIGAAVVAGLMMDGVYHVLAMGMTYIVLGKLDKH